MNIFNKQSEIKQKYTIGDVLGSGNFAEVRLGTNKETKETVAIKIIEPKDQDDQEVIEQEINILGALDHKSIIKLYEVFSKTKNTGKVKKVKRMYVVMELATGGELFDRIVDKKFFNETEAREVIKQLLESLVYMHSKGIVHRDLKPENILYANESDDSPIKVADFGLAKLYRPEEGEIMGTMCGTPGYVAPEILKPKDEKLGYNKAVDMWSTGVILYIILCGFPPFYEKTQNDLFKTIIKGKYSFPSPYWDNISDEAKDLIRKCLVVNPLDRITAAEALQHPWMQLAHESIDDHIIQTDQLKLYQSKLKFKRVKNTIIAVGRLQLALKRSMSHHE